MRDAIANIQYNPSGTSRRVEAENRWNGEIKSRSTNGFKENLRNMISILFRIEGGFCNENGVFISFGVEALLRVDVLSRRA